LNADQSRRAILDAGTAAELAMTTLIDKYLDHTNVAQEPVRQALARGYNNLGAKKELLKILRPGLLSTRVQPDLIDKRNTASHGDDQITFEQAQVAVEIATEIVESAHPLAGLLPTRAVSGGAAVVARWSTKSSPPAGSPKAPNPRWENTKWL
jgi:hypothetical protein